MLRNAMVVSTDQRYEGIWSIFTQKALHYTKLAPNPWKYKCHLKCISRMSETHFVSSHVNMIGPPTYNIYQGYISQKYESTQHRKKKKTHFVSSHVNVIGPPASSSFPSSRPHSTPHSTIAVLTSGDPSNVIVLTPQVGLAGGVQAQL